ncbi:hypothetical protein [Oleomonas cavernae]|uniref:hypothetical protein n=1 Tax=Oleomonas cavernae TaxID=2320859 RepID=UPI0011C3EC22|nr:hypothetical protein [Oleomonas cavernae]
MGEGHLDDDAVERLRRVRARSPIALVDALTQLGLMAERDLARHLAHLLNLGSPMPPACPASRWLPTGSAPISCANAGPCPWPWTTRR